LDERSDGLIAYAGAEVARSEGRGIEIDDRPVVLIGMMGAGKTTVGRLLASRLGWKFWDNDEALEAETGMTADALQRRRGQAALHQTEDRLLREALRTSEPTVFAAAGSIVLDPAAVARARTVWLRVSAADEERNIAHSGQGHRPLPADSAAFLERLGAQRQAMYAGLADITVDVAQEPHETCDRVLQALGRPTGRA
jgi:shikimate kinase